MSPALGGNYIVSCNVLDRFSYKVLIASYVKLRNVLSFSVTWERLYETDFISFLHVDRIPRGRPVQPGIFFGGRFFALNTYLLAVPGLSCGARVL